MWYKFANSQYVNKYLDALNLTDTNKEYSFEEIKQAYRNLAKIFHPDASSGNQAKFVEINSAYKNLKNLTQDGNVKVKRITTISKPNVPSQSSFTRAQQSDYPSASKAAPKSTSAPEKVDKLDEDVFVKILQKLGIPDKFAQLSRKAFKYLGIAGLSAETIYVLIKFANEGWGAISSPSERASLLSTIAGWAGIISAAIPGGQIPAAVLETIAFGSGVASAFLPKDAPPKTPGKKDITEPAKVIRQDYSLKDKVDESRRIYNALNSEALKLNSEIQSNDFKNLSDMTKWEKRMKLNILLQEMQKIKQQVDTIDPQFKYHSY